MEKDQSIFPRARVDVHVAQDDKSLDSGIKLETLYASLKAAARPLVTGEVVTRCLATTPR